MGKEVDALYQGLNYRLPEEDESPFLLREQNLNSTIKIVKILFR